MIGAMPASLSAVPASLAAGAINRLTAATPLARERLMRFAGKTAVFRVGPLPVALTVQTTGDVEFAGEVAFLAKHLKWDIEEDLSRVVGDAAANRAVSTARAAAAWGKDASERMAAGAAEYFTEEDPLIASRVKVEDFIAGVSELRDAVERLDKRIERLERE